MANIKGWVGAFRRVLAGTLAALVAAIAGCGGDSEKSENDTTTVAEVQAAGEALCTKAACGGEVPSGCADEINEYVAAADANGCLGIMDTWLRCLESATECVIGVAERGRTACNEQEELAEDCRKGRL